jgi:hypothetical protein
VTIFFTTKETKFLQKTQSFSLSIKRNPQLTTYNIKWLICYSVIWLFSESVTIFFTTKETKFLQKTQSFSLSIKRNPQLTTYNIKWLICYSVIWLFSESVTIFFTTKEKKFLQKTQSFSLSIKRNLQLTTYNPQLTTHNIQRTSANNQPTNLQYFHCIIVTIIGFLQVLQCIHQRFCIFFEKKLKKLLCCYDIFLHSLKLINVKSIYINVK